MSNSRIPAASSGRERSALSRGTPQRTSVSAVSGMSSPRAHRLREALLLLLLIERLEQAGHVVVGDALAVGSRRFDAEVGELVGVRRHDRARNVLDFLLG